MGSLGQKLRSGLVELITDSGPQYANPSMMERVYLLWTFRNFRRLPWQVLNLRQRELIDRLSQAAALRRAAGSPVIGVVENVRVASELKPVVAARPNKVVEIATAAMARAVGSERITVQMPNRGHDQGMTARIDQRPANVKALIRDAAAQRRKRNGNLVPFDLRRVRAPHWLKWALVAMVGAALIGGLLYYRRPALRALARSTEQADTSAPAPPAANSTAEQAKLSGLPERKPKPSAARPATQVQPSTIAMQPAAIRAAAQPTGAANTVPQALSPTSANGGQVWGAATLSPSGKNGQMQGSAETSPTSANGGQIWGGVGIASGHDEDTQPNPGIAREVEAASTKLVPAERVVIARAPQSFSYPVAPNAALTGKVSLKVFIGTDGSVSEVKVISGNRVLADAAVRAVRRWRYRPAELDGHAAQAETNVTINFIGDDAVTIAYR